MARGVAFQLIEALGVLERQKVAEEVKGLDQAARATLAQIRRALRRLSHLPAGAAQAGAARARDAAVGAQARSARTPRASTSCCISPPSGRTSIPVDKETPKPLYRTAGYRVCGERAVRVDILERLADLIRPALAWREGVAGAEAGRRVRRPRLHRHRRHDVAHRRLRRGLRLDPALARLSHGAAAETAGAGCAELRSGGRSGCTLRCSRTRCRRR